SSAGLASTVSSIWSPPISLAMEPRSAVVATTLSFALAMETISVRAMTESKIFFIILGREVHWIPICDAHLPVKIFFCSQNAQKMPKNHQNQPLATFERATRNAERGKMNFLLRARPGGLQKGPGATSIWHDLARLGSGWFKLPLSETISATNRRSELWWCPLVPVMFP